MCGKALNFSNTTRNIIIPFGAIDVLLDWTWYQK